MYYYKIVRMSSSNGIIAQLYEKHMSEHINNVVSKIKSIADNDTSDKPQNIKEANACFASVGQKPDSLCPHGLQFFQCMPCSH